MKRFFLWGILLTILLGFPPLVTAADNLRFHYIGTSNFRFPTAEVRTTTGYVSDGSHNSFFFAQPIFGRFLEVSGLRHLNGPTKNENVLNLKVTCLEEDQIIPSIVWGVSDVQEKLGSKVFFFAGSKNLEAFGATIHAGIIKDPVSTKKNHYFGFEKVVLPLVVVAAESFDGNQTIGIKVRPYPGVSVEYAQTDVNTANRDSIYKLVYFQQM
jgi:hypothetical protein